MFNKQFFNKLAQKFFTRIKSRNVVIKDFCFKNSFKRGYNFIIIIINEQYIILLKGFTSDEMIEISTYVSETVFVDSNIFFSNICFHKLKYSTNERVWLSGCKKNSKVLYSTSVSQFHLFYQLLSLFQYNIFSTV